MVFAPQLLVQGLETQESVVGDSSVVTAFCFEPNSNLVCPGTTPVEPRSSGLVHPNVGVNSA